MNTLVYKRTHRGDPDESRIFGIHDCMGRVRRWSFDAVILIKGSDRSRLLKKAVRISVMGRNRAGQPLKVLSPEMQETFGSFKGRLSFQRSPTRWVDPEHTTRAAEFMRSLE